MNIKKEEVIEAVETIKEYCEEASCPDCHVRWWCDNMLDPQAAIKPIQWEFEEME